MWKRFIPMANQSQRSLTEWLELSELNCRQLAEQTNLDLKVVEAIVAGRYTTSPAQRQNIAAALNIQTDDIRWGKAIEPIPMYGHGPQFGRSP